VRPAQTARWCEIDPASRIHTRSVEPDSAAAGEESQQQHDQHAWLQVDGETARRRAGSAVGGCRFGSDMKERP